jgi:hypothetical protein
MPSKPGRLWFSTYALMIDNGAPPHEVAMYDGDHKCFRCVDTKYRWRNRLGQTPLREFTSLQSCTIGGYSMSRCTWSS